MPQQDRSILALLRRAAALLPAMILAGCTGAPAPTDSGPPIAISPATQGELASYLQKVKVTRPGAFAVSVDGRNSFYTWCDDTVCMISTYSIPALRGCQSFGGKECIVLYVRNEPRRAFTRASDAAPGQHGSEEQMRVEFD